MKKRNGGKREVNSSMEKKVKEITKRKKRKGGKREVN
jgi:hypothetical protein